MKGLFKNFRSKMNIMKGYAIVVTKNALVIIGTSWILALQHVMDLVILMKSAEILELLYLSRIVTKNLIKEQVTILETTYVDRNYRHTFPI